MIDIRECEVCLRVQQVHVVSSSLAAMSHAYCEECLNRGAEPLWAWEATVGICGGPQYVAKEYQEDACSYSNGEYISWDRIVELCNWDKFDEQYRMWAEEQQRLDK